MDKQSKLEKIAIKYRNNTLTVHGEQIKALGLNDYSKDDQYNENHKDAQWDENNTDPNGKPLGKGTNSGGHTVSLPDSSLSSDLYVPQIDTERGGGSHDVWGRKEFESGREYLQKKSLYNKNNQYTKDSIDIDQLIDGQYFVR